ncbi:MAG: Fur family transcriptional regulator [Porticoccaceae bacterium]
MLSNSRSAYHLHNHQKCVNAALQQARERCMHRQARLTPIREAVLALIWDNHKPMGAYQIVEQLPLVIGKNIQAPSVYRAIDFLLELGLIHRITSLNAYIGCPFPGREHSNLFMICRSCGIAAEVSDEGINGIITETIQKTGFRLEMQAIELSGLCPACQEEENN